MIKNLKQFLFVAGLLLIAAGAQPVYAAFWQWSTTAANNATADPSINWSEGMSPSSVNDSARAMMSVLAKWRGDVGGNLQTAGTSTAYTVTTNSGFTNAASMDNAQITFNMHATNGINPTLNIDGIGAFPITTDITTPVPPGTLIIGSIYEVVFYNSVSKFVLKGLYGNPYNVPLGSILWSTLASPPNANFVAPSGQCISTTTYSAYWVALGSPASGGCPGGQFAVIDMRGRVVASLDTLNASAANRLTSVATGCGTAMTTMGAVCANGLENHTMTLSELVAHSHGVTDAGHNHGFTLGANVGITLTAPASNGGVTGTATTNVALTGISINSTGSGTAFPMVQPTIGLIPYLRIL